MEIRIKWLPIEIYVSKNNEFFAEISWLLYKYFGKKRTLPCGQKEKYIYCAQPMDLERVYFSEDKRECYCKVCDSVRIRCSHPLDEKDPWGFERGDTNEK